MGNDGYDSGRELEDTSLDDDLSVCYCGRELVGVGLCTLCHEFANYCDCPNIMEGV